VRLYRHWAIDVLHYMGFLLVFQEFIVWMRVAATNDFAKLHRQVLDRGFTKGDIINITIFNRYPAEGASTALPSPGDAS